MLSNAAIRRVDGELLGLLYEDYPKAFSPNSLAKELGRDNEFIQARLAALASCKLVERILLPRRFERKNALWRLKTEAKKKYDQRAAGASTAQAFK